MAPYVASSKEIAGWNSANCGNCYELSNNGTSIYVTAVDAAGGADDLILSEDAFTELFGNLTIGHGEATVASADASKCKGNLGSKKTLNVTADS